MIQPIHFQDEDLQNLEYEENENSEEDSTSATLEEE